MSDAQLWKAVERQTQVLRVIAKELCLLVKCFTGATPKDMLDKVSGSEIDEMDSLFREWYGENKDSGSQLRSEDCTPERMKTCICSNCHFYQHDDVADGDLCVINHTPASPIRTECRTFMNRFPKGDPREKMKRCAECYYWDVTGLAASIGPYEERGYCWLLKTACDRESPICRNAKPMKKPAPEHPEVEKKNE